MFRQRKRWSGAWPIFSCGVPDPPPERAVWNRGDPPFFAHTGAIVENDGTYRAGCLSLADITQESG
jgi:hypothetical protein